METISIALTGDTHADGESRFEDHNRITNWICDDAVRRGCRAMLHSGDAYERATTTAEERAAVAAWAERVARHMPLVMVGGNHDNPLDIEMLGMLSGHHPIQTATTPRTWWLPGDIAVHCLPWPRRAYMAALQEWEGRDELNRSAGDALRNVLRGFAAGRVKDTAPSILLAHAMVRGSRTSNSQPPLVGHDFEIGLEDLALAEADFYALGHIHLTQEWEINAHLYESADGMVGAPAIYPGSPRRCNFGETEEKSYVVATFEGRRCVNVERVPTPAAAMIHMVATWNPAGGVFAMDEPELAPCKGAEVRFRYDVPAQYREAARAAARRFADSLSEVAGAASVKVEERIQVESRARAPEVTAAITTWDKLVAHWNARKGGPGERLAQVRDKFENLEGPL